MIIDVTPLLAPVSPEEPSGTDIRDTPDYETIAAEIEKLSSPTSSGQIDWQKVESLGTRLFSSQGKDFMVAAWVATAWTMRYGIEGLGAGLILQEGLVSHYWETAQPPVKRLRGRRNALSWWIERAGSWLENIDVPPLREETHQSLVQAAETLDSRLAELDPDSEPLGPFVQQIRRLAIIEPAAAPSPDPAPAADPALQPTTNAPAAAPEDAPGTASAAGPAPARAASAPVPTYAPAQGALEDLDGVLNALTPALSHISAIASALRAIDRLNPLTVDMVRFAARSPLLAPPPAQDGLTALSPPPVAISDAFGTIIRSGNADGLIEFCESRIAMHPCWLDLDRESARGYALLGPAGQAMQQAIIQSTLAFVKRLPGIELLSFSDGMPFADEATRQWLEDCRQAGGGEAGPPASRLEQAQRQARAALDMGRRHEAAACYQTLVESSWSGRDRFQARLWQAELALSDDTLPDPLALAASLTHECRQRKLADWEPELARQAWQLHLDTAQKIMARRDTGHDADDDQIERAREAAHKAMRELAAIDPTWALKARG